MRSTHRVGAAVMCLTPGGPGQVIAIVLGKSACPIKAGKAWIADAGTAEGLLVPAGRQGRAAQRQIHLTDKLVC